MKEGTTLFYKAYLVKVASDHWFGYIINHSQPNHPTVYLSTFSRNYNDLKASILEKTASIPDLKLESIIPDFLLSWTKNLEQIIDGKDCDTSRIPLDLTGYTEKQAKVIHVVHQQVPVNEYYSYSEIAELAGFPNAQRFVGSTMRKCRQYPIIPCHRIKNSQFIKKYRKQIGENPKRRFTKIPL